MKWVAFLGVTVLFAIMTRYEWPKLQVHMKKEKIAFAALSILGWVLSFLLIFYRELPGPTQGIHSMYQSLVRFLEK
jgi:hypothetical protein